jgi:hypothetical protein
MPPKNFRSISVTERAHARMEQIQAELVKKGLGALPPGLLPDGMASLTVSSLIEIGMNAVEQALKGVKR